MNKYYKFLLSIAKKTTCQKLFVPFIRTIQINTKNYICIVFKVGGIDYAKMATLS